MAQASFQWQRLVHQLQDSPLTELDFSMVKQVPLAHLLKPGRWFLGAAGGAILLFWDGKLVLATGAGAAIMFAVYLMQAGKWQPWAKLPKLLNGVNRQLALAVGAGGVATLGTYMAAAIWVDSGSPWIALGETMQGVGILAILGLLGWQSWQRHHDRDEAYFNQLLADLTHRDPLKRLIAVRQINHLVAERRLEPGCDRTVADSFRLMLSREQELSIRDAVLEGLYELDTVHRLSPSQQPALSTPVNRTATRVRRRVTISSTPKYND